MKVSYSDKLKDPRWQKKRLEILQRDNFTCVACGATDKTLHVHHCYYVGKRSPWEYDSDSLLTFCEKCHAEVDECQSPAWWWMCYWQAEANSALKIARSGHPENTDPVMGPKNSLLNLIVSEAELPWATIPLSEMARILFEALLTGVINDSVLSDFNQRIEKVRKSRFEQEKKQRSEIS